jgi:predicted AlkP superfamily phosphohydrolase/phosphomutase
MNAPRTFILGLDGATFDLIDPLIRAGCLPTLQHLIQNGTRATLNAFPDMNSAAAWSSLVTGYNAGEHGIFHFDKNWYKLSQKSITPRPTLGADRQRDPFWCVLSNAGQRVGIINVPISFPADPLNGFMLAGMDTPGVHSQGFCYPASLYEELRSQGIAYEIDTLNLARLARQDPYHFPEQIKRMTDARARAILYLMDTRPWDVLMGVFIATDRVQHFYWHEENTEVHSPSWTPLRELYQQLDHFLADSITRLDSNTTILIVSDHGFGRKRRALHALNELLAQLGLLEYSEHTRDVPGTLLAHLLQQGRRIIPSSLQYPLSRLFPALHFRALTAGGFGNIDWSRTQVFADPDGWGVYVNLLGREPEGIVPVQDYDALLERMREILLRLRDGESGRAVVREVFKRDELFHGPHAQPAPDLTLEWNFETVGDSLVYKGEGQEILVRDTRHSSSDEKWKATHRPDGILIAYGAQIKRGATLSPASLYDIAPTILYLQGQSIPSGMDGTVLTDLFTPDFIEEHPITFTATSHEHAHAQQPDTSNEDLHLVEQRLRDLGYLDSQ